MEKKFRILSFLMTCLILFFFMVLTPRLSIQTGLPQNTPSEPTLSLGEETSQPSSEVIIIKTPLHLTPVSNVSETVPLPVSEKTETESTSAPESTSTPAPSISPESTSTSNPAESSNPSNPTIPSETPGKEIPQGGYPESHLWEKQNFTTVPGSDAEKTGIPTTSNSTSYTGEDLFSDSFLAENPMTEKGKPGKGFQNVSQNGGLDVIPKHSGINGRAIYGPRTHVIEDGDSLDYLALRYLGDSTRTDEIFEANRSILPSKEELPIGAVLVIPERF